MRLVEDYRRLHAQGHFDGTSLVPHVAALLELVRLTRARTLLDYGCGKALPWKLTGKLVELRERVDVTLYDPALPEYERRPGRKFDLVVCTDVLEHVPEDEVDAVLDELFELAERGLLLAISTRGSHKRLPRTGGDVHALVRPEAWWREQLKKRERPGLRVVVEFPP